jgi:hypothetical protein
LIEVNPPLQNKDPIIDSIYLSYNLVEQYVSSFLQKEILKTVAKGLIMLKVHAKEHAKERMPRNYLYLLSKFCIL